MTGAGRGNGEPHETFNADFGRLGATTQYMTRPSKEARIERAAHQATSDKALRLPEQLCRMEIRAVEAQRTAVESAAEIMDQLLGLGLTGAEIVQRMEEHVSAATSSSALGMPWEAQYAEAKLIVHKAHQAETDENTPGLSSLFEDAAFAKLAASSTKVKAAKATVRLIERLQAAALRQLDTNIGSEDFQGRMAEFVVYKILQQQVEIERLARVLLDADALLPNLAERPADQARLMKTLQKSANAIGNRVARLRSWVTGSFVPEDLLADDVVALRENAVEWDVSKFCRGVFSWQSSCSLGVGDLTQEQLIISRLVLRSRERRRSSEEINLLQNEKELSLRLYKKQETALQDALAQGSRNSALSPQELLRCNLWQ